MGLAVFLNLVCEVLAVIRISNSAEFISAVFFFKDDLLICTFFLFENITVDWV